MFLQCLNSLLKLDLQDTLRQGGGRRPPSSMITVIYAKRLRMAQTAYLRHFKVGGGQRPPSSL